MTPAGDNRFTLRRLENGLACRELEDAARWVRDSPRWVREMDAAFENFFEDYHATEPEGFQLNVGVFDSGGALCAIFALLYRGRRWGGFLMDAHLYVRPGTPPSLVFEAARQTLHSLFSKLPLSAVYVWVASANRGLLRLVTSLGFMAAGGFLTKGSVRGRPLGWHQLCYTRGAYDRASGKPPAACSPPAGEEWSCSFVAVQNLFAWAGIEPPTFEEIRRWAIRRNGVAGGVTSGPPGLSIAAWSGFGLSVAEVGTCAVELGFPFVLSIETPPGSLTWCEALPAILAAGKTVVLFPRLRYRGRMWAHAAVALRSRGGEAECLDSFSRYWHGRRVPWSFGLLRDCAESVYGVVRGGRGGVTRYGLDTIPTGDPGFANGESRRVALGLERYFLLVG